MNPTTVTTTTWALDPMHSEIQFKVKHLVISTVTGSFKTFDGSATTEGDDWNTAKVNFSADIASIDTNMAQRDEHLRGADFFDAETHPRLVFESTAMRKVSGDTYKLEGNLTIKGVSRPITFDVEYGGSATDFYGNTKAGFELTGKLSRKEFGLTWNGVTEAGAIVVGDEIKLIGNVQFAKQK
ncbi:MAG: YceI family protein [Cytophagales bacterium]|nr:YceI family protein [Cytophagales bacterium]